MPTGRRGPLPWPCVVTAAAIVALVPPGVARLTRDQSPGAAIVVAWCGDLHVMDDSYACTVGWGPRSPLLTPIIEVDPWGRPFVYVLSVGNYGSLGPDGVPSPDDLDFAQAHALGSQSPWLKLIAWRWPLSVMGAVWVLAIGLAARAAPRQARWAEAVAVLLVAAPSGLLAYMLVRSGLAWWAGEVALAPVAMFPDRVLPTTIVALGLGSAIGARAWARR